VNLRARYGLDVTGFVTSTSGGTIAALQTFATTQDPAGGGYELIASTPTSRTELASLRLGAVD
jgi:hypothetical protein